MAKDLNKVQLTGRLGADPEMRQTPQGHAITTFRVASNRTWRTQEGAAEESTEWFRVVAWNRLAEICNQWLAKGARVYVEGRMQTRQWEDTDGQSRSMSEVVANDIIILESRRDGPEAGNEASVADTKITSASHIVTAQADGREQSQTAKARPQTASASKAKAAPVASDSRIALEEEDLPF